MTLKQVMGVILTPPSVCKELQDEESEITNEELNELEKERVGQEERTETAEKEVEELPNRMFNTKVLLEGFFSSE